MFGPPENALVGGAVLDALDDTLALVDAFDEVFVVDVDVDEDDLELNKFWMLTLLELEPPPLPPPTIDMEMFLNIPSERENQGSSGRKCDRK